MPALLRPAFALALFAVLLLAGCRIESTAEEADPDSLIATSGGYEQLSADDLERYRYRRRYGAVARVDTAAAAAAARANPERLADIDRAELDSARIHLPLGGDAAGPSVLHAQILLDRAGFSPGVIDGRWGDNAEKAVFWFQEAHDLPATGVIDSTTFRRLRHEAGRPDTLILVYRVTAEDVAGPFDPIPDDVYAKAEMDSLGYESLSEMLGETFHATPGLLRRLNPGVNLDRLAAGDPVRVPNVRGARPDRGPVDRLVVSGEGEYLHALGPDGRVLYHVPTTIGASYDPSPQGDYRVESVTRSPWWRYQPGLLADVPDDEEEAHLPPGPNNAVGLVWIALSAPHFGIHGTSAPETIGYTSSAGCVRLTNWDALFLAGHAEAGMAVDFRDVPGRDAPGVRADTTRARADSTEPAG